MSDNILKEIRTRFRLTQPGMAALLGVSSRTYQRYETASKMPAIANHLLQYKMEKLSDTAEIDELALKYGITDFDLKRLGNAFKKFHLQLAPNDKK